MCVRIWPHKMAGEAAFLALLHKRTPGEDAGHHVAENPIGRYFQYQRYRKTGNKGIDRIFLQMFHGNKLKQVEVRKGQVYQAGGAWRP